MGDVADADAFETVFPVYGNEDGYMTAEDMDAAREDPHFCLYFVRSETHDRYEFPAIGVPCDMMTESTVEGPFPEPPEDAEDSEVIRQYVLEDDGLPDIYGIHRRIYRTQNHNEGHADRFDAEQLDEYAWEAWDQLVTDDETDRKQARHSGKDHGDVRAAKDGVVVNYWFHSSGVHWTIPDVEMHVLAESPESADAILQDTGITRMSEELSSGGDARSTPYVQDLRQQGKRIGDLHRHLSEQSIDIPTLLDSYDDRIIL